MDSDQFIVRLARIRERFAASLPGKIDDSIAAISSMAGSNPGAIETIVLTHRRLHEMCGVAPSIGFPVTGKAARAAETVLREPAKSKRLLTSEEVAALMAGIDGLRSAASAELQSNID